MLTNRLCALHMLLLSFLFLPTAVNAAEEGPEIPDYPVDRVADNIYVIHGPVTRPNEKNQGFMNNPGFVLTSKGVVIIDPGGTVQAGEMVLRAVRTITDKPVIAVFDTHVHGDHWLGNQAIRNAYPDVPIYAHPNFIAEVAAGVGDKWVQIMLDASKKQSRGTKVVNADHALNPGDKIILGDTSFDIYNYGVAHTDTDIMIAINGNTALFTGDNLINGRLGNTLEGNIKGLIETDEKVIEAVHPKVIIPGHGSSGGLAMFNYSIDFFRILYKTVGQLYQEDMSDYEMKPKVIKALAKYRNWEDFDLLLGKTISQAYLEIEAVSF